jgi:hypothetical protein
MKNLPFVKAADIEGDFEHPPCFNFWLKFSGVKNVSMGMNITGSAV